MKLAIIGYGNQAKAWALNLRDSSFEFSIGLRAGSSSIDKAKILGFHTFNFEQEASKFTHFVILTPDDTHHEIVTKIVKQNQSANFIYAHGFSYLYAQVSTIQANHLLLAPKSIASELRFEFETKGSIPAVFSLEHNQSSENEAYIKTLAKAIGITHLYPASFEQETKADLFSEQSILCGGLPFLAQTAFQTLINKGIPKELAYFESIHELKLIAKAFVDNGPDNFFNMISPAAFFGSELAWQEFEKLPLQDMFNRIYDNIQNESFIKKLSHANIKDLKQQKSFYWKSTILNQMSDKLR